MPTFTKQKLSGSTNGRMIKLAATASPGTTIHTAVAGTTVGTFDEIWLYAVNNGGGTHLVTVEFGGTTSPDDRITLYVPNYSGLVCIVPGLILQNGTVVRAFAATTNVVSIGGYVNAIAV